MQPVLCERDSRLLLFTLGGNGGDGGEELVNLVSFRDFLELFELFTLKSFKELSRRMECFNLGRMLQSTLVFDSYLLFVPL